MRIGTKLFVALAVPITVLIVLFAWLDERDSRERTRDELAREGRAISRTVQLAMEFALRDRQLADVHQLIDQITGFERVLGIRLFNRDGSLNYQSPGLAHVPPVSRADVVGTLRTGTTQLTRSVIDHHSVVAYLAPVRERYEQLRRGEGQLEATLQAGAERARKIAEGTLADVRERMGLGAPRG